MDANFCTVTQYRINEKTAIMSIFAKEYRVFAIFIFLSFLIFAPFLTGLQRVHDSFYVSFYGGFVFMRGIFEQGRVVAYAFYRILEIFNPPYTFVMSVSVGFSLIFLSIAAYIVYCLICQFGALLDCRNTAVLTILGCYTLFFNLFVLEFMLFFENAVMSLGILLATIACVMVLQKRYGTSILLMIFSVFCYQPSSVYFMPLTILFLGVKYKESISVFIRKSFCASVVFIAALLSNYMFLLIVSDEVRFTGDVRVMENVIEIIFAFFRFGYHNFNTMPPFIFSSFLGIFLLVFAFLCKRQRDYFALIVGLLVFLLVLIAPLLMLLPMATDGWHVMPRSGVVMASIGGFMLINIALISQKTSNYMLLLAALFVLVISQRQLDMQRSNFATNHLDMQELSHIIETIQSYESHHGITVRRIYFTYDEPKIYFRGNLNQYRDITIRVKQLEWMPRPLIRHYLGSDVEVQAMSVAMTREEIARVSGKRHNHWFTNGILVFEEDTVFIFFRS